MMPFEKTYLDVYEQAIKPTAEKHLRAGSVWRADSSYWKEKIEEIKKRIQAATIVIVDISEFRPAVMWELGYCEALGKPIILICRKGDTTTVPFNIRSDDSIRYETTEQGLALLRENLNKAVQTILPSAQEERHSCLHSVPWRKSYQVITEALKCINSSSFRGELAGRELKRVTNQMAGLQNGLYTLRKIRPMDEIIDCYCDLLEKMREFEEEEERFETFDTVSCIDFWRIFSEDGQDNRYLAANIDAAMRGVKIRRLFLLDSNRRGQLTHENTVLKKILLDLVTAFEKWPNVISMKYYESPTYDTDLTNVYTNFGILRNTHDTLLLQPQYATVDGQRQMHKTEFVWAKVESDALAPKGEGENALKIRRFSGKFEKIWGEGSDLTSDFIETFFTRDQDTQTEVSI